MSQEPEEKEVELPVTAEPQELKTPTPRKKAEPVEKAPSLPEVQKPYPEKFAGSLEETLEDFANHFAANLKDPTIDVFKTFNYANRFLVKIATMIGVPVATVVHWPANEELVEFLNFEEKEKSLEQLAKAKASGKPLYLHNTMDNIRGSAEEYQLYREISDHFAGSARSVRPRGEDKKIIS